VKRFELWLLGAFVVGIVIVFVIDRTAKHELHLDEAERAERAEKAERR
jgi:zinc transporter ZupT